jgi:propanol-preferring alcohol dehydrogenase
MRAWVVGSPGSAGEGRPASLRLTERPEPVPGPGEVLIDVSVCGICRTDLHLVEGDLPHHVPEAVPGHEVVGRVVARGDGATRFAIGERIGVAWLRGTCGFCRWCRRGEENLCPRSTYTGWDADGGYAEQAVVAEAFAYRLPESWPDERVAPLLCAGIVGYRALRMAALPPGGRLGIYGFGASAHLTAQVALHQGATVHVMTRSRAAQELALSLGCSSAGGSEDLPPEPLDSALLFAPAGALVPVALSALDRGGTLAVAGIHLSDVPVLDYQRHLFQERRLQSVTANTRADGEEFLRLATAMDLAVATVSYPFLMADRALADLAADRVDGAAVLDVRAGSLLGTA